MTSSFAGMTGISGSMERTLTAVKRGREGDKGSLPADPTWYFPPGAWYVDHAEPGGERIRHDFWCAAGVLAHREAHMRKTLDGTLEPLCDPDVRHERTLVELIDDLCATATDDMLPPETPKPSEETLALPTGKLALDVVEGGWTEGPNKMVTNRDFSARDPWASALAGLALERRFEPLRHVHEVVAGEEKRREVVELEDWGPR
jgi:hypothetical protein